MPLDPFLQQSLENVQPALSVLSAGQAVFGGRFVLQRCLGQGGMGQVWLAQDTTLDEPRALKFVLPALVADATARKRLRNEARLGTHLAHPRIVRVFDFVEESGGSPLAAVAMEYVEGRTLSELLAEQEPGFFEPEQIASWINDVAEGLRYAHEEKQRYHLDLKPGNIIIETATGRAKLLDFGISRSAKDTLTRLTGQTSSGTLPYMSPQQLDGEPPCAADDVYGLGATVYELLTGTPPFFRGKLEDQIRTKEPEPITSRRRQNAKEGLNTGMGNTVSGAWEAKVSRMLRKDARGRQLPGFETPPIPSNTAPGRTPTADRTVVQKQAVDAPTGDNLGHLTDLVSNACRTSFFGWMFAALVVYVALGFYAWARAESYQSDVSSWGITSPERIMVGVINFLVFFLPVFFWGRQLKTAPWSMIGTILVFACWGCFPIAVHVLLVGLTSKGIGAILADWFYTGTVYRLLEVNLVASGLVGLCWCLALRDRFAQVAHDSASISHLRRVTILQVIAFVSFLAFIIYCYHLPA